MHPDAAHSHLPGPQAFSGVSVVIPVYNALDDVRICVDSLYSAATTVPFEVIIVDNGSDADVGAWAQSLIDQRDHFYYVRLATNLGYGEGINCGARYARGDVLCLLNSDTYVTAHWLDRLTAALDADPTIGVASPTTNNAGNPVQVASEAPDQIAQADTFAASLPADQPVRSTPQRLVFSASSCGARSGNNSRGFRHNTVSATSRTMTSACAYACWVTASESFRERSSFIRGSARSRPTESRTQSSWPRTRACLPSAPSTPPRRVPQG